MCQELTFGGMSSTLGYFIGDVPTCLQYKSIKTQLVFYSVLTTRNCSDWTGHMRRPESLRYDTNLVRIIIN